MSHPVLHTALWRPSPRQHQADQICRHVAPAGHAKGTHKPLVGCVNAAPVQLGHLVCAPGTLLLRAGHKLGHHYRIPAGSPYEDFRGQYLMHFAYRARGWPRRRAADFAPLVAALAQE